MNVLIIFLLLSALLLTRVTRLSSAVAILLAQSAMIAFACVGVGLETGESHMYVAAILTLVIKAGIIPFALWRLVSRLRREREDNPILNANYSSLAAGMSILLAYTLIDRAIPGVVSREPLAAAISLVLIGLILIMARRQAILQVVGLITMENGLYLLGLSVTKGLPLIIELGIFFDILVAVIVLVILTYRLKVTFFSTDTTVLKKLKG